MKQLESEWVGLVSKNYEIEQALINMEAEYENMKRHHEKSSKGSAVKT
jgi:hypothetical protein